MTSGFTELAFGPGRTLGADDDCVHLAAPQPLWTLSSALVNACLSASESKVRALQSLAVRDPDTGTPASGTSTDCLAIAATQRGAAQPYAGSGARLGRELGQAAFRATLEALLASREWQRRRARQEVPHG